MFSSEEKKGEATSGDEYPGNEQVLLKGGHFTFGSDSPVIKQDGEGPGRIVTLDDFYHLDVRNVRVLHNPIVILMLFMTVMMLNM